MRQKKLIILITAVGIVFLAAFFLIISSQKVDLCAELFSAKGEINCKEAMNAALQKYPGEVLSLKRFNDYATKDGPRNIWLVEIHLKNTLVRGGGRASFDFINVGVDRLDRKLLFFTNAPQ